MGKSIRQKVSLFIAIIVFLAIFISMATVYTIVKSDQIDLEKQCLQSETSRYAEKINVWMSEEMALVKDVAKSIEALDELTEEKIKAVLISNFTGRTELLDLYFGTENGEFWKASTASEVPEGYDPRERGWYQETLANKNMNVTNPYFDAFTFQMCDTIAYPVYADNKIIGIVGIDITLGTVTEVASNVKYDEGVYSFVVDKAGNFIFHPNEEYLPTEKEAISAIKMMPDAKEVLEKPETSSVVEISDYTSEDMYIATDAIGNTGWMLGIAFPVENALKTVNNISKNIVLIGTIVIIVVIIVTCFGASFIVNPIKKMKDVTVKLASGELDIDIEKSSGRDEIAILQNSIYELTHEITGMITDINKGLCEMSNCNLAFDDIKEYPGKFNDLSMSVNSIKDILDQLIFMVQEAAREVDVSSMQLAKAADALAQSSASEASSIQSLRDNIQNISGKITRSSDNCVKANEEITGLNKDIHKGNNELDLLYKAVDETEAMSNDISKIVGTIDSIAFQTNILALNASVEAARAGEAGKGFAVVAEEVGSLAEKCASESAKTAELIERCLASVKRAKTHAEAVTDSMNNVVGKSENIAFTFDEISKDTVEQANDANRIIDEIERITSVIESNTATAQETAASTEELSTQSNKLTSLISQFRI